MNVKNIAVVGSGLMGHGIAQAVAQCGYQVSMQDLEQEVLVRAMDKIRANLCTLVEMGLEQESFVEEVLGRIWWTTDLEEAVARADLVFEAVPENLELKIELFQRLEASAPEDCILASNSSTLSVTRTGKKVRRKHRMIGTHWFNPAHLVPVVEVIPGRHTSPQTLETTMGFLESLGKEPVRIRKEVPGFLVNRIQTAMFREVLALLEQGVAEPQDIDRAVRGSFGIRLAVMGPLETADLGGLDLWYKGGGYLYKFLDNSQEPQQVLRQKVERGELGRKSGKGFFEYEAGQVQASREKERDQKLIRLLSMLYPAKGREPASGA